MSHDLDTCKRYRYGRGERNFQLCQKLLYIILLTRRAKASLTNSEPFKLLIWEGGKGDIYVVPRVLVLLQVVKVLIRWTVVL